MIVKDASFFCFWNDYFIPNIPQKERDFSIDSEKSKRLRTKDLNSLKLKENDRYSSSQHGRRGEDEYINR